VTEKKKSEASSSTSLATGVGQKKKLGTNEVIGGVRNLERKIIRAENLENGET